MKTPFPVIVFPSSYIALGVWFIALVACCFKLGPFLGAGAISYYANALLLASWSHVHSSTNIDMLGGQSKCIKAVRIVKLCGFSSVLK